MKGAKTTPATMVTAIQGERVEERARKKVGMTNSGDCCVARQVFEVCSLMPSSTPPLFFYSPHSVLSLFTYLCLPSGMRIPWLVLVTSRP